MKYTELKPKQNILDYIIDTMFAESICDDEEAAGIEVQVTETHKPLTSLYEGASYVVRVDDTKDNGYGIHTEMTVHFGGYSAIVDVLKTTGDPLYAIFQYTHGCGCHVEYIHK